MKTEEIAPGLWRRTAPHPDWTPDDGGPSGWERDVGCLYYEGADAVVLIDPLVPAEEADRFWNALDRDVVETGRPVVLLRTVHWHQRSIDDVLARYPGTHLWTRESTEPPPAGIEAYPVGRADETLSWLGEHRALVAGDVLIGAQDGGVRVCPDSSLPSTWGPCAPRHADGVRVRVEEEPAPSPVPRAMPTTFGRPDATSSTSTSRPARSSQRRLTVRSRPRPPHRDQVGMDRVDGDELQQQLGELTHSPPRAA